MKNKNYLKLIPLSLGVIILSLSLAYLLHAAVWTEPTATPPRDNVPAPINVGITAQHKAGEIGATIFRDFDDLNWFVDPAGALSAAFQGRVGIGTVNPGEKLDVIGSAGFTSIRRIGPGSNNPERGPWNPLWTSIAAGRAVYADEEFALGKNGVGVYNNAGGDGVQHFWETGDGSQPNQSGKWIRIVNNGNPTSPGFGGFVQTIHSRRNATFVQRFRAKLPVGYFLNIAENPQGTNRTSYWLTSNAGTGKWEEYIRISHSGNTGIFSTGGHVFVTGPGKSNIFTWYLASSNVYEVGSPPGIFSGNVGIGDTTPDSKLDVEGGDIRISTAGRGLIFPDGTKQTTAPVGVAWPLRGPDGTVAAPSFSFSADHNTGIRRGGVDDLRFVTAGVDRVTINAAGNVGIGTTAPASVAGVARILEIESAAHAGIVLHDTAAGHPWEFWADAGDLRFWRSGPGHTLTLDTTGRVGIGTTGPAQRLHVVGAAQIDGTVISHNINTGIGATEVHLMNQNLRTTDAVTFADLAVDGSTLVVDHVNNRVGIGDTTPDSKLDVEGGDIRISTTGKGLIFPDGTIQTTAGVVERNVEKLCDGVWHTIGVKTSEGLDWVEAGGHRWTMEAGVLHRDGAFFVYRTVHSVDPRRWFKDQYFWLDQHSHDLYCRCHRGAHKVLALGGTTWSNRRWNWWGDCHDYGTIASGSRRVELTCGMGCPDLRF